MRKKINQDLKNILIIFLTWRILLFFIFILAIYFIPLPSGHMFLGGGYINYNHTPELFSWANFDGEHYLAISLFGYNSLEQAFFPLFPILINFFSKPFEAEYTGKMVASIINGLLVSNISFFIALAYLWKLIKTDFNQKIAYLTLFILLLFPTSFYFGSLYNESLFLLLSVLAFYNARKSNWFLAGIFGALASATRVFGILLLPALLIEAYQKKESMGRIFWLLLIPLGLLGYMVYQYIYFGDPLAFYNLQTLVGEQHQKGIVILPQVYFRYIKILTSFDLFNPLFQTIVLEFAIGILFFLLPIYGYFKKIRLSYIFYAFFGFMLPTIQGSFSSLPRYVLILFPSFLALALWIENRPSYFRILFFILILLLLIIEASLFLRGYWVA